MSNRNLLKYVISLFLGLISTGVVYFLAIDGRALPNKFISQIDYRNLIFKYLPSPRIIIDSGSNSFWSIMPQFIEKKFQMPTLVVSENGNVPFELKMLRLKTYAQPGDIILLPYEWLYYSRKEYTSNFIESVLGITKSENVEHNIIYNYTYYYYMLPIFDKIQFVFKYTNPEYLIRSLIQRYKEPSLRQQLSLRTSALLYNLNNNPYGDVKNDSNRLSNSKQVAQSCYQYLAATQLNDISVLKKMMMALDELQKERNVKIIITWPAVAGINCYVKQEVERLTAQIKDVAESSNLTVVGNPFDSYFPESNMLDTNYHVDSSAALLRTMRLISNLEKLDALKNKINFDRNTIQYANDIIQAKLFKINEMKTTYLQPLQTGSYKLNSPTFDNFFYLPQSDWYPNEGWGQWSKGSKSKIVLRASNNDCHIKMQGRFFAKSYSEIILIGQKNLNLSPMSSINIMKNEGIVSIEIYNRNIISPKDIEASEDNRKLGFGLEEISVEC